MNINKLRFAQKAKKTDDGEQETPPEISLSTRAMADLKRLSGYCFAQNGAHALCLNKDPAFDKTFRDLKPSLTWHDERTIGTHKPDLLIGDGILQDVFVEHRGGWKAVRAYLAELFDNMEEGGRLILRENAMLIPEEMVLLELPDYSAKAGSNDISHKLLKRLSHFSKHARPWLQKEYQGFFCEEVAGVKPDTKLFSVPLKWASEFILRRDLNDSAYEKSLEKELVLGTERALRIQLFNQVGFRVVLHAPHWDREEYEKPKKSFQLYKDDDRRTPLPPPPNELIIVLEKPKKDYDGLWLSEQRSNQEAQFDLALVGMDNKKTGDELTIVTGLESMTQILPWRYLDDDRIGVYLKAGEATPMINTKPRSTSSIDGKRYNGYMPAPVKIESEKWEKLERKGAKQINQWMNHNTGLGLAPMGDITEGKLSYPAPDFIDQAIQTIFMEVREDSEIARDMRCYDANDILHAIHSGLAPSATLEAQIWQLAKLAKVHLTILTDVSVELEIDDKASERISKSKIDDIMTALENDPVDQESFKVKRGNSSDWRLARSVFIEEAHDGPQHTIEQEFVLSDEEEPLHRAALMCLSRSMSDEVLAGFEMTDCPIPTRYGKPGKMLNLPTVPLPGDIRSIPQAREYLAKHLEVEIKDVIPSGEAVFTHAGVTPQKIFPFMITKAPWMKDKNLFYAPVMYISYITELDNTWSILWKWGETLATMGEGSEFHAVNNWEHKTAEKERRAAPAMKTRHITKNYG